MIESGLVSFHDELQPLLRDIDSVRCHPDNYQNGDVELIQESILASGMYRPIYVQKTTGYIVAGNHTWLACKEMDATVIPVVELDISDTTAHRLIVADNEIARKARRDDGQLLALLANLHQNDSLMGTGFNEQELTQLALLTQMEPDFTDDSDRKQWPTLCFQVPPHVRRAFFAMTDVAGGDREKFELLLRLAGWSGRND